MRLRVTVRGESVELRGYTDSALVYADLARLLAPLGLVVTARAERGDWDPFAEASATTT